MNKHEYRRIDWKCCCLASENIVNNYYRKHRCLGCGKIAYINCGV